MHFEPAPELSERLTHVLERFPRDELLIPDFGDAEDAPVDDCFVVGDAVWDLLAARRARMLCVGLLSGGYGDDELTRAGAFRVYRDTAELHDSLDELGVLP